MAYLAPDSIGGQAYLAPDEPPATGSTVTGVTLTPSSATVSGFGTQHFDWTVVGTGSPSQAVTLTTTLGSISPAGDYSAPVATGSIQTATITATSVQDPTKSGTATVTISAAEAPSTGADAWLSMARRRGHR